jgi:CelD/BcsL family acetyltransferase involved in cellulose biosynthesis
MCAATGQGIRHYDFLMGTEEYKFGFGASPHGQAVSVTLTRKQARCLVAATLLKLFRLLRTAWKRKNDCN